MPAKLIEEPREGASGLTFGMRFSDGQRRECRIAREALDHLVGPSFSDRPDLEKFERARYEIILFAAFLYGTRAEPSSDGITITLADVRGHQT
jgi:hypothetical protein